MVPRGEVEDLERLVRKYAMELFPCLKTASWPLLAVHGTLVDHELRSTDHHKDCRMYLKTNCQGLRMLVNSSTFFSDPEMRCTGVMMGAAIAGCRYMNFQYRRRRERRP